MALLLHALFIIALFTGALALQSGHSDNHQCGDYWNIPCGPYDNSQNGLPGDAGYASTSITFTGGWGGEYQFIFKLYNNTGCSYSPLYSVTHSGTYEDLGAANNVSNGRRISLLPIGGITVFPQNAAFAMALNSRCPCGGTWTENGNRAPLTYCDPSTCTDTRFMNGASGKYLNVSNGIQVGSFMYAITSQSDNNGSLAMSSFSWDYVIGSTLTDSDSYLNFSGTGCKSPINDISICGSFVTDCQPHTYQGVANHSQQTSFIYTGISGNPNEAGLYSRTVTYFRLENCTQPFLVVNESGTLMFQDDIPDPSFYETAQVIRNAATVTVTPLIPIAVERLTIDCPCNGVWAVNTPRLLTTCLPAVCNDTWWIDNLPIGSPVYGNIKSIALITTSSQNRQVRLSTFTSTFNPILDPSTFNTSYHHNFLAPCMQKNTSTNYCGTWSLTCSNSYGLNDEASGYVITGSPDSSGLSDGTIAMRQQVFNAGLACSTPAMAVSITRTGQWSSMGSSALMPGSLNVEVFYGSTQVTLYTDEAVAFFNDPVNGCPCGGTWVVKQIRYLTTCPLLLQKTTCPSTANFPYAAYINGTTLGQPSFGNIFRFGDTLRITQLSSTAAGGYLQPFDVTTMPFALTTPCATPSITYQYCGTFIQNCRADASISPDMDIATVVLVEPNGVTYLIDHSIYFPNNGCTPGSLALNVLQTGTLANMGVKQVVATYFGFQAASFEVTPAADMASDMLNSLCPCGGTAGNPFWQTNKTTKFSVGVDGYNYCPPNTCNYTANKLWARGPVASKAFGFIQRIGDTMRLTVRTPTIQYNSSFQPDDFTLARDTDLNGDCAPAPAPSSLPSSKKLSGGSILLIIFFVCFGVYFGAGVATNYVTKGSVAVPNQDFWQSLPGYIKAGFAVTLSTLTGATRSGGESSSLLR